jgi:hypothetical protein
MSRSRMGSDDKNSRDASTTTPRPRDERSPSLSHQCSVAAQTVRHTLAGPDARTTRDKNVFGEYSQFFPDFNKCFFPSHQPSSGGWLCAVFNFSSRSIVHTKITIFNYVFMAFLPLCVCVCVCMRVYACVCVRARVPKHWYNYIFLLKIVNVTTLYAVKLYDSR